MPIHFNAVMKARFNPSLLGRGSFVLGAAQGCSGEKVRAVPASRWS